MPSTPEFAPRDFIEILGAPDLPLIVGGQAVNLWAELYATEIAALGEFQPFVSKDADIFGTRILAEQLARRTGWKLSFDPRRDQVVAGILRRERSPGMLPLTIEVLSEVNGLTAVDLAVSSVVEIGGDECYRIPAPTVLLKAKLYNLASLVFTERPQDLKHARMLCQIVPHYLRELHAEFRAGRLPETTFVKAVAYTADVITSGYAGNAANGRGLDLTRVIPPNIWSNDSPPLQRVLERLKECGLALPPPS
jgi:hypothetical protein